MREDNLYLIRLPKPLKKAWRGFCEKKGKKIPDTLRALMRYMIIDEMDKDVREWLYLEVGDTPDTEKKKRLQVNFTESEYKAISERAEAEITSPQNWVISCVRASLLKKPQYTMEVTKALWESNYQLRAIGRNLNQIAKVLNQGNEINLTVERIEKLSKYIYSHTEKVADMQEASINRWIIKNEK